MKKITTKNKSTWCDEGQAPDYRFSLANERTYLAWIRTALALLAGAIGIDQLAPTLASPEIRMVICSFLCLCSGLLAVFAYRRWIANEQAMRSNQQLNYTNFLKIISLIVAFLTLMIALIILL